MAHVDHHPVPVEGCFGCKVLGVGFDGRHTSRSTRIPRTPEQLGATVTEHRDGRQDTTVHAPTVRVRTRTSEER